MIASLRGRLAALGGDSIVLDVGGVGFLVHVPEATLSAFPPLGQELTLFTHMVVRENDLSLYGFATTEQLELFRVLLGVTGIGPRTALATLSAFSPEALRSVIASGDAAALARTPGIGRKTAQRLLLDLRDRLGPGIGSGRAVALPTLPGGGASEVVEALLALGYSQAEVQEAVAAIPEDAQDLDARILAALRYLGGR